MTRIACLAIAIILGGAIVIACTRVVELQPGLDAAVDTLTLPDAAEFTADADVDADFDSGVDAAPPVDASID